MINLPERLSARMVQAGAAPLINYAGMNPHAAERFARQVWEAMIEALIGPSTPPNQLAFGLVDWSHDLVRDILVEAARTIAMLPPDPNGRPAGFRSNMPEVVRTPAEAYGMQPAAYPKLTPSSGEIQRMLKVCDWLIWAEVAPYRKLIWIRALNLPWPKIARIMGYSERTCRTRHKEGLQIIAAKLNEETPITGLFAEVAARRVRQPAKVAAPPPIARP